MNSPMHREKWIPAFACRIVVALSIALLALPLQGHAAQAGQKTFASPEEAVKALIGAVKADNLKGLNAIFGPAGKEVLGSGDAVQDKAAMERFLNAYEVKNALVRDGDAKTVLQVGVEEWPFPIPIVKKGKRWFFDTKKGKEELINRRVGRNELDTIQTCLAYVDAQREYAVKGRENDGLLEYAQKIVSTSGTKDGLYWEAKPGQEESPLGDFVARATREGYKKTNNKPIPYHGYYFKILKGQGKNAPGGAYDYVLNGKMIGGFGLIAYPAQYDVSGVMTFIVNHDGIVYQKDLGKETAKIAGAIGLFDPDPGWKKVEGEDR
ncbi:MAG TPA: DUF2950 domain-containing protein [Syntrophorhabdaceae bacterium]